MMTSALLAALLAATAPRALPAGRPVLLVTVQQETADTLDARALRAIDGAVSRMWRRYADVSVRDASQTAMDVVDDVLTVVVTDRRSDSGDGLGWIEFRGDTPSRTIYVSRGEVLQLTEQGQWAGRRISEWPGLLRDVFLRRAMALAIAHEVGHYLLRSKAHAEKGLMRARFTSDDLMNTAPATYRLTAAEERVIRQRQEGYLLARVSASGSESRGQ